MTVKVFDFFSGCGGTSRGFADAGMDVVFGLDIDRDSGITYKHNFPKAFFVADDIRNVEPQSLSKLMEKDKSPILFCGCAPCQPFSKQNRQKSSLDPRQGLLAEFARFVSYWLPDYVFIENVPGIQKMPAIQGPLHSFTKTLAQHGYHFVVEVVPALWFGVPQTRERLVLLANRREPSIKLPEASHGGERRTASTVREWISGLPPLEAGETDPNDPQHIAARLSKLNLKRIVATPEGGSRASWPKRLWLDCHKGHGGHSDVYGRLAWDRPASGLTTRCISYSNGRFGHPNQHRALSIREAACLQTFPRNYHFSGSLASRARQIGNAVPPLMAHRIGEAILEHASAVRAATLGL